MAGRPKRAELVRAVTAAGGEELLISRIESGETVAAIASSLGVSRPMLSSFLNRDSDSKERIARAREQSAHALVEEALAIADSATHDDDRAKRLQVSMRQWMAGKYNREVYGDDQTNPAELNIQQVFLDSLRQSNKELQTILAAQQSTVVDSDVTTIDTTPPASDPDRALLEAGPSGGRPSAQYEVNPKAVST
jgi:predicted transcriptional regulator